MKLKNTRPLSLALALLALMVATSVRAGIPAAESLLPSDTLFVLTAPDCAALRKAAAESPQLMLWNDPAMKPFHDKFMGKLNDQFVGPLEQDLGVSVGDFINLPQGQFTLALTKNGWDGLDDKGFPGLLLLLDAKDKRDLLKTALDALQKKWAAAGKPIRTETIHGIPFSVVPLASNDIPAAISSLLPASPTTQELGKEAPEPRKHEIVFAQYQSLLIAGNSLDAVEPVVARLTGGSAPCLADNPLFASDQASQFRDSPVYYSWFNARSLFGILSQIPAPQPNPQAPSLFPPVSASAVLNASGLMGLRSVSLSFRQTREGALVSFYLAAPETARQGILKIIATGSKDASPPGLVPADAVKFWRWRVDSQVAWAELQKVVSGVFPGALGSLNGFIDMANTMAQQKDATFDLRKNLIANLGDDWMSYEKGPAGTSLAELSQSRGVFLFAASNPEQTILALKTVTSLVGGQDSGSAPQPFMGHTIYLLALRPQVSATGASVQNMVYCAISGGYVAVSADISELQDYLRNVAAPPRPLSDTPGLAEAIGHIGGAGNGLFAYQDHRVVMRATFSSLQQAEVNQPALAMLPKSFSDWIDFSLLPDFGQVSKYFYFSVFNGTTTPDGILFKGYYPRPPQMN